LPLLHHSGKNLNIEIFGAGPVYVTPAAKSRREEEKKELRGLRPYF
jgi:hypothetical protein